MLPLMKTLAQDLQASKVWGPRLVAGHIDVVETLSRCSANVLDSSIDRRKDNSRDGISGSFNGDFSSTEHGKRNVADLPS